MEKVASRADLREFIDLPLRLHPRNLLVPLIAKTVESWWQGRSPHPEQVDLLLVRNANGAVVGRSTAHSDSRLDQKLGVRSLLFGATDFADSAAAAALFAELEQRAGGREQLFGPVSLLPNQVGGVITSAFGERGFVDSPWNPEWVPGVYEALGFQRWGESDTWAAHVPTEAASAAPEVAEWETAGLRLEVVERRRINEVIPELLVVLNSSFDQLPYYTQISTAEMTAATESLAFLVDKNLALIARDATTDAVVSFVLALPDFTSFVQRSGGRIGPLRQLELLATRGRYRQEAIVIIQGTEPARQGQGVVALLGRQLMANLSAGGYQRVRTTWIGRDNPRSSAQFKRLGGRPLHGVTFYRRPISDDG